MFPCESWPLDSECATEPDGASAALVTQMAAVSTELLWAASGRRYGPCLVTARPCLRSCSGGAGGPYKGSDGNWYNSFCGCGDDCSCTSLCEIVLDGENVFVGPRIIDEGTSYEETIQIGSVTIDGDTLDPSAYRIDQVGGQSRLLRLDGSCWPSCQTITADCDSEGSFCVTYESGLTLTEAALWAHTALTYELVKSCLPNCECRLPRNVTTKTRQGVTVSFDLSKSWLRALPEVAAWLDSVNPRSLGRSPLVMSPDIPKQRTT